MISTLCCAKTCVHRSVCVLQQAAQAATPAQKPLRLTHNTPIEIGKDSKLLEEFRASFCMEDRRRVVSLPKKRDTILPSNRFNAEKRLNNLTKRLENNDALK